MARTPRLQHRRSVEAAIIHTGLNLFEQRGFDATRVEDIAAALGISARTIFRYFPAKADIVLRPMQPGFRTLPEKIAAAPDDLPAIDALAIGLRALAAALEDNRDELVRHIRLTYASPTLRRMTRALFDRSTIDLRHELARRLNEPTDSIRVAIWSEMATVIAYGARDAWLIEPARPIAAIIDEGLAEIADLVGGLTEGATANRPLNGSL